MTPPVASHDAPIDRPADGFIQGFLPPACAMCTRGTKLVVFVTGKCHYECFYCPVNEDRRNVDRMWANETPLDPDDLDGVVAEAKRMGAMGAGLTGGDPLYAPERTLVLIRRLKDEFGPRFNIHLYTNIVFDPEVLPRLKEAGLDEIRFHPPPLEWLAMDASPRAPLIRRALEVGLDTGIEVPAPPNMEDALEALLDWALENGVDHVNLNELEFAHVNADALKERDYEPLNDTTMRVAGSKEVALEMVKRFHGRPLTIHFCTSPFKDAVQMRNRLRRLAERIREPQDVVTDDGTLLRGLLLGDPRRLRQTLRRHGIRARTAEHDEGLLVHPTEAEHLGEELDEAGVPVILLETYPTIPPLDVERVPLNRAAATLGEARNPTRALMRFP